MSERKLVTLAICTAVQMVWALSALAQVDTAWVRRYNGPMNDADYAEAIAVDGSGNVYVTGWSRGSEYHSDYATIKYYPNGDTAWVRRYNGPVSGWDAARAIVVDGSGNVYVTGESPGYGTGSDYATIKYYPSADTAWVRRYNGPGDSTDRVSHVAVDDSGNVCVTGYSYGSGTGVDYATIKYVPNGDTAWVRRYNGPGNGIDLASSVVVDDSGNVYVTGTSMGSSGFTDYATVKYYPNGDTAWVRTYNGPGNHGDGAHAIALDNSGNIYVAGSSCQDSVNGYNFDCATIRYYSNGDTAWVRTYDGPANDDDGAALIAVDGSGNVYVTGNSIGSGTSYDYATIKYYPNGDTAWVRRYNGPGNDDDYARSMAVDDAGNVYVTGYSIGDGTSEDYATIKYNSEGDTVWVRRYNGPLNIWDEANGIAVDGFGNVYVTGGSAGNGTHFDYTTIKYWPNFAPTVVAPDSSESFCEADTIRFSVAATDPDADDTLTLSGPGIPVPIEGVSPLVANVKIHVSSGGNHDYVYTVVDTRNGTDIDTSTWSIDMNDPPAVIAPDSSIFLCGPDTITFTVTATDPDVGDTLTLTGPGIPAPISGVSPLSAEIKMFIDSDETYDFIYTVTDTCEVSDADTATWAIIFNSTPGFFSLLFPVDSGFVLPVVTFDWEDSADPDPQDEVAYDLHVSTSSAFHPDSTNVYDSLPASGHTDSLDIGRYFWKVRAYDSCEETWSTESWNFLVVSRGDCDADGVIDIGDVVYLINFVLKEGPSPNPLELGDANCDGVVDLEDVVYLLNYLFKGGPEPSC